MNKVWNPTAHVSTADSASLQPTVHQQGREAFCTRRCGGANRSVVAFYDATRVGTTPFDARVCDDPTRCAVTRGHADESITNTMSDPCVDPDSRRARRGGGAGRCPYFD
jgi:hypothetical protein